MANLASYKERKRLAMEADELLVAAGSKELAGCWGTVVACQVFRPYEAYGDRFRGLPAAPIREPRPTPTEKVAKVIGGQCKDCGGPVSAFSATGVCRGCYRANARKKFDDKVKQHAEKTASVIERFSYAEDLSEKTFRGAIPDFAPGLIELIYIEECYRGQPIVAWRDEPSNAELTGAGTASG